LDSTYITHGKVGRGYYFNINTSISPQINQIQYIDIFL
jgi:hypothetical protein